MKSDLEIRLVLFVSLKIPVNEFSKLFKYTDAKGRKHIIHETNSANLSQYQYEQVSMMPILIKGYVGINFKLNPHLKLCRS